MTVEIYDGPGDDWGDDDEITKEYIPALKDHCKNLGYAFYCKDNSLFISCPFFFPTILYPLIGESKVISVCPNYIHVPLWINEFDSSITVPSHYFTNIDRIMAAGDLPVQLFSQDEYGICSWKESQDKHVMHWMSMLKKWIPVFLVSPDRMPVGEGMESLGCYFSTSIFSSPVIFLCPERINQSAKDEGMDPCLLYAIVTIHEFAHAVLDKSNMEIVRDKEGEHLRPYYPNGYQSYPNNNDNEEAWANYLMLKYIERGAKCWLDQAKAFVSKQPGKYQLGGAWFNGEESPQYGGDWVTYRDNKSPEQSCPATK